MSPFQHLLPSETARQYAALGWKPIPLKPRDKVPAVKWKDWDAAKLGFEQFKANSNIAIRLGEDSQNLFDLDFDWPSAAKIAAHVFSDFPAFGRPSNPDSHRIGRYKGKLKTVKYILPTGSLPPERCPHDHASCLMEVRGDGSYTMFPGSMHPCGESVAWSAGTTPVDMPEVELEELIKRAGLCAFLGLVLQCYPAQGTRHHLHLALAGALARAGYSSDEINRYSITVAELAGDEEAAQRGCGVATVDKISQSPTTGLPRVLELLGLPDTLKPTINRWLGVESVATPLPSSIARESYQSSTGDTFDISDHYLAAELFISKYLPSFVRHKGINYCFNGKFYEPLVDDELKNLIFKFLSMARTYDSKGTSHPVKRSIDLVRRLQGAIEAAAHLNRREDPPFWLKSGEGRSPETIINVGNGLLHVPTRELLPHTSAFLTLNGLNYDYQPSAKEPQHFLEFLKSVWPEPNEQDNVQTLQEMFGYFLVNETHYQKLFFLYGPTRSGKGVISRLLTSLVGAENVVSPSINDLGETFGMQDLMGKQLALMPDTRLSGRVDRTAIGEKLLRISGEDTINVQRKFSQGINVRLRTRIFMSGNELPAFSDSSTALVKRFIILKMRISQYGSENPNIGQQLETELAGILNWALDGYERLTRRGYFTMPKAGEAHIKQMEEAAAPVRAFLLEACELGPQLSIPTSDLHKNYIEWAEKRGISTLNLNPATFGKKVSESNLQIDNRQRQLSSGAKINFYIGVALKKQEKGEFCNREEEEKLPF